MNIKSEINWRKSVIALALMCAVFSFSAAAQTNPDERLDAEAAALVQELSDGLPDLLGDEVQVRVITSQRASSKWARGEYRISRCQD